MVTVEMMAWGWILDTFWRQWQQGFLGIGGKAGWKGAKDGCWNLTCVTQVRGAT